MSTNMTATLQEIIAAETNDTIESANSIVDKITFFKTEDGEILVRQPSISDEECFEVNRLVSSKFHDWLFLNAKENYQTKINKAVYRLEVTAKADKNVKTVKVFNRIGYHGETIYLNLCDEEHNIVEINSQGWNVLKEEEINAPILFVRNRNMKALPVPKKSGNLTSLRKYLNASNEDFSLLIGWLLVSMNPLIECPILWLNAGKGRGKTTATELLKGLIDPDFAGALAPFRKVDDYYATASSRYIVAIDNMSRISPTWSDVFCRAVTGAGAVKRKNYTDNDAFDVRLRTPLIMNGIDFVPGRSDLQDRTFPVTLKKLDEKNRKSKKELTNEFEREHAYILGALLDSVVKGLQNKDYTPEIDVRMLDASRFIMRAARGGELPFSAEQFKQTLLRKKSKADDLELDNDPVARAIYDMAQKSEKSISENEILVFDGLSSELMKQVREKVKSGEYGSLSSKDVPTSPRDFGYKLSSIKSMFEDKGFAFVNEHKREGSSWRITFNKNAISFFTETDGSKKVCNNQQSTNLDNCTVAPSAEDANEAEKKTIILLSA